MDAPVGLARCCPDAECDGREGAELDDREPVLVGEELLAKVQCCGMREGRFNTEGEISTSKELLPAASGNEIPVGPVLTLPARGRGMREGVGGTVVPLRASGCALEGPSWPDIEGTSVETSLTSTPSLPMGVGFTGSGTAVSLLDVGCEIAPSPDSGMLACEAGSVVEVELEVKLEVLPLRMCSEIAAWEMDSGTLAFGGANPAAFLMDIKVDELSGTVPLAVFALGMSLGTVCSGTLPLVVDPALFLLDVEADESSGVVMCLRTFGLTVFASGVTSGVVGSGTLMHGPLVFSLNFKEDESSGAVVLSIVLTLAAGLVVFARMTDSAGFMLRSGMVHSGMLALVVDPTTFPSDTISEAGFGMVLSEAEVSSRVVCSGVLTHVVSPVAFSLDVES